MTAIVGILCNDGVVVGADSSTTFSAGQFRTIEQKTRKIHIINDRYIVAGTGQVGVGQRFIYELENFLNVSGNRGLHPVEMCRRITGLGVKNLSDTGVKEGSYGALLAFPSQDNKHNLCEFDQQTLQPELKNDQIWYVSMGSGQLISDPFLAFIRKIFWQHGKPSLTNGIFSAIWTLQHAIDINPGGIADPIDIAVLELIDGKLKARLLTQEEIKEHLDNIKELEKHVSLFDFNSIQEAKVIPPPPSEEPKGEKK